MLRVFHRTDVRAGSLFLVGVLLVVIVYFWKDFGDIQPKEDVKVIQAQEDVKIDIPQARPHRKITSFSGPKCERNESAAEIPDFKSLTAPMQDFLYHKKCRNFPMLLDVSDKCGGAEGSAEVFLLLVIKSPPENHDAREVLRKTWAQERSHKGAKIRRVFITGSLNAGPEKDRMDSLLKMEQRAYDDILQWDFNDSFYNTTLKQVLFLQWMDINCPKVRFLLYCKDDVFVHTDNMIEYLHSLKDNNGDKHLFIGSVLQGRWPTRLTWSKIYIPDQLYGAAPYPVYCDSAGILMSGSTASVIYLTSKSVDLFPLDDVYLGMCMQKAEILPSSHMAWRIGGMWIPEDEYGACYYREMILIHRVLPPRISVIWEKLNDSDFAC